MSRLNWNGPPRALCLLALGGLASAQTPPAGKLIVTVVDVSGGVLPTVTVTGLETATKAAVVSRRRRRPTRASRHSTAWAWATTIRPSSPVFTANVLEDITVKTATTSTSSCWC